MFYVVENMCHHSAKTSAAIKSIIPAVFLYTDNKPQKKNYTQQANPKNMNRFGIYKA